MVYTIQTKECVWWSARKLDAIFKHIEFRRPHAKYREMTDRQFSKIKQRKVAL